jgi:hypothetical protein
MCLHGSGSHQRLKLRGEVEGFGKVLCLLAAMLVGIFNALFVLPEDINK